MSSRPEGWDIGWSVEMLRLGIRDRVVLVFGLLTLVVSLLLTSIVWLLVSDYLLDQRITSAISETRLNAAVLQQGILDNDADIPLLLEGLSAGGRSAAIVVYAGAWYGTSLGHGPTSLPVELTKQVRHGMAVSQRVKLSGVPYEIVGVPLAGGQPGQDAGNAYFELYSLAELNRAYRVLSGTLVGAVAAMVITGLLVGRAASRRALRPLAELTTVGAAVARGDLTARLDAEDDPDLGGLARSFNQMAESLQRRVHADARFAGDVSHQLRTPLTTMLTSMELLQHRRDRLPADMVEPLDLLAEDLSRFRRLVVDLLEISRTDTASFESISSLATTRQLETVTIGELVRQAADSAAGRPVTIITPDAATITMQADKRRLEQVITNLVENAEVHGGGCHAVTVQPARGAAIEIVVDDAGPGVPPQSRERVFERFDREGGGPGVGLGLASVAVQVHWHGGTVRITDRPGGGARFLVELPVRRAPGETSAH